MRIVKTCVAPDLRRKRFFDGEEGAEGSIRFDCGRCDEEVVLPLWPFIVRSADWKLDVPERFTAELALKGSDPFVKAHDGGRPYISLEVCDSCEALHIVYIGFREFQPARYVASLQGVYLLSS